MVEFYVSRLFLHRTNKGKKASAGNIYMKIKDRNSL